MISIARLPLYSTMSQIVQIPDDAVPLAIIDRGGLPSLSITIDDAQPNHDRTIQMRVGAWNHIEGEIDFDQDDYIYLGVHGDFHFWLSRPDAESSLDRLSARGN
jgi:hypothetical protein